MSAPEIAVLRLPHAATLPLPRYESAGAAGLDLRAALAEPLRLEPGARASVPTGFAFAVPPGFEMQVRPRSGLAARLGLTVLNTPGTVDSDYRGEVVAILVNHGTEPVTIQPGARIAQAVVAAVSRATLVELDALPPTARGAGGFGSTGV